MDEIMWSSLGDSDDAADDVTPESEIISELRRRLAMCEAVLGQITTGVAVLEPRDASDPSLELVMLNEVAALYFGWIGPLTAFGSRDDMLRAAASGLSECGLFDLAELVSLTGQAHHQESVSVPGAVVAGHVIDLCITPIDETGAVTLTFVDVTHRMRQAH